MPRSDTASGSAPLIERWPVLHPVTWFFAVLPFQWIAAAGGAKLPYLALLAGLSALFLAPRAINGATGVLNRAMLWLVPYAVYLMVLHVALHGSQGQGIALRQAFFLSGFVLVAAWLAASRDPARMVRWWGGAAILSFLAGSEWIARGLGLGWPEAVVRFVQSGDLNFVVYGFFREIFNATAGGAEANVAASQKNMVSATMLLGLILFRAGHAGGDRDRLGLAMTVLVVALLIMLNTRTVLLSLALALVLIGLMGALRGRQLTLGAFLLRIFAALAASLALVLVFSSATALTDVLGARFAFDDYSSGARLQQYVWALQRIEQAFLTGSGYAELNGHPVHNLFLGAFMHAGVGAFLLVCFVYGVLLAAWWGFALRATVSTGYWVLPVRAEWVAVLPLQPMLRMWFSGDAGHNSLVEWTALGAFAGLVAANEARRSRLRRRAAHRAGDHLRGMMRR